MIHLFCSKFPIRTYIVSRGEDKMEKQILKVLPSRIQQAVREKHLDFRFLQEIRLRAGQPVTLLYQGREERICGEDPSALVTGEEVQEAVEYICNHSLYAYENELRQGFVTIEGGHRVGVAGQVILEQGKVKNIKYISSINLRISHEIMHCADPIFPYITRQRQLCHTLLISPPRCGKTTMLRDLIRQISDGNEWIKGTTVGVVDERSEIGGCYHGQAQNHLGARTDILDCCPKAEGMIMLIRSMAPQVLAVDEIGACEDLRAIEYAMHCGCRMLATAHGSSVAELRAKPYFDEMFRQKRFDRYVVLGNDHHPGEIFGIYDERGSLLYREKQKEGDALCSAS